MISRNLIKILSDFTKEEFEKFGDFVSSPYFNKQDQIRNFFNYLKNYYPKFDPAHLTKEAAHKNIYPHKIFVESRIRNLCSDLKLLAEKFMAIEAFAKESETVNIYKLQAFNLKRNYDLFLKRYDEIVKQKAKPDIADEWAAFNNIKLFSSKFTYLNANNTTAEETENILKQLNDESVKFFLSFFFKNCHRILNKKRSFFKYGYMPKFFETACSILENNKEDFKNETFIFLNYYSVLLYMNYDENSFKTLKEFVFNNFQKLSHGDATDSFTALINYCRTQSLKGNKEYEQRALDIYKFIDRSGFWNKYNKLRPTVYRTAAAVAGNCGDFKWGEKFINKYKSLQPEEHIESNYYLCYGRLYFDMHEYERSIGSLTKVMNEDPSYKYETDSLLMKIYYEIDETEALLSKIDSFRHWINNNGTVISDRYRVMFKTMVDSIDKLVKLKLKPDSYSIEVLKQKIEEDKSLVNRLWMLEKISHISR
ncbi:hypothetical protein BH10BAC5_BH10BAC5_29350 [soil metagenome]